MGKSGIFHLIRRGIWLCGFSWLAGFAMVRAVADETAGSAPVPVTAAQARLKEMFPETYTKAVAEFGWHQYRDGRWGGLHCVRVGHWSLVRWKDKSARPAVAPYLLCVPWRS